MPRPLIGLTTYAEEARFGLQDTFSAVLPLSYVHAVHETGGRAVLITPDDPDPEILDGVDGIVFTGGSDVDPALYGDTPHGATRVKPNRDRAELMLLRAAAERGVPLLGICRGHQVVNVALGGTLYQDLAAQGLTDFAHATEPARGRDHVAHLIEVRPGTLLRRILGGDRIEVNSFHHQAVRAVAPDMVRRRTGSIVAISSAAGLTLLGSPAKP